jgi:hypothetical protein
MTSPRTETNERPVRPEYSCRYLGFEAGIGIVIHTIIPNIFAAVFVVRRTALRSRWIRDRANPA